MMGLSGAQASSPLTGPQAHLDSHQHLFLLTQKVVALSKEDLSESSLP